MRLPGKGLLYVGNIFRAGGHGLDQVVGFPAIKVFKVFGQLGCPQKRQGVEILQRVLDSRISGCLRRDGGLPSAFKGFVDLGE